MSRIPVVQISQATSFFCETDFLSLLDILIILLLLLL